MPTRSPRKPRRSEAQPDQPDRPIDPLNVPIQEEDYHDWLEPIGSTGFYQSPVEPVDPQDCDRWPDSPYCGGTGIDPDGFSGLGVEVGYNQCEVCVTVSPTLAFVALPPYTVCYRKPECRPSDEPTPDSEIPPNGIKDIPVSGIGGCDCQPYLVTIQGSYTEGLSGLVTTYPPVGSTFGRGFVVYGPIQGAHLWKRPLSGTEENLGLDNWFIRINCKGNWYNNSSVVPSYQGRCSQQGIYTYNHQYDIPKGYGFIDLSLVVTNLDGSLVDVCENGQNPEQRPPFIPPISAPPVPPLEPMDCCNETLELTRLIAKRLGTDSYPVSYPKSLLTDRGEGQVKLESLTALIDWFVGEFDALIGEFPAEIEIEDIDPTKAGNQKKKVKLPNLAESIAEIYGLTLRQSVDSDVTISFLLRLATETMAAKNAAIVAQDYARANASYLGYKGNKVERIIDYAFDPTKADSIDGILNETTKKLLGWEEDDPETVAAYLQKLMFAAGIIKAVFFRGGALQGQLLKEAGNLINRPERADEDRLWKQFLDALNNPNHRVNSGNNPDPKVRDLSTTNIQGLSNLMNES